MTKNIIWDVDGSLFDTCPAVTYTFSKALNRLGFSVALNVIDSLVRQSLEQCLDVLSQRFTLDPDVLWQKFNELYETIPLANQPPFPGVQDVCRLIHQIGGRNVIVTHRSVSFARRLLAAHHLSELFDGIISTAQGFPPKPDPAIVRAALDKHELNPASTLLIGNRGIDIQAGQSAGVRTCLFGNMEQAPLADLRIEKYSELLQLLYNGDGQEPERSPGNER